MLSSIWATLLYEIKGVGGLISLLLLIRETSGSLLSIRLLLIIGGLVISRASRIDECKRIIATRIGLWWLVCGLLHEEGILGAKSTTK